MCTYLAITLMLIVASSYAQNTTQIFVKPTNDTECPSSPCLTLSQYVEQVEQYFVSDTDVYFLAGDHLLQGDSLVTIHNVSNFVLAGAQNGSSRVLCNGNTGLSFSNASLLQLYDLSFMYCGATVTGSVGADGLRATLHLDNVRHFLMTSCFIENGRGYGLIGENVFDGLISHSAFLRNNYYAFSVCNNCSFSAGNGECIGGNVFFRYNDGSLSGCPSAKPTYNITVSNVSFMYGVNLAAELVNNRFLNRGSGLAFELKQMSYNIRITVRDAKSRFNTAAIGANLYIVTTEVASESTAVFIQSTESSKT